MAFGIPGITPPTQPSPATPTSTLDPLSPTRANLTAVASPTLPADRLERSSSTTNPNAYHEAIARTHGNSGSAPVASPDRAKKSDATGAPGHAVGAAARSVADMSLAEKVATTARAGMASAAHDARGTLKTALSDPKTQATLAAGTAVVVGAQFVPGADVAVDATLGTAGVVMYATSAPEHRDNIAHAASKLKEYAGEVGGAKTQADLDKASKHFAQFVKLGGTEALDALGTVAGGVAATSKVASGIKAIGGVDGAMSAASSVAGKVGDGIQSAAKSAVATGDSIAQHVVGGLTNEPAMAAAGPAHMEMRAMPEAIRPTAGAGIGEATATPQAKNGTIAVKAGEVLEGRNPNTLTGLHPNASYEFQGGFTYHTDGQGRVHQVEATLAPGVQAGDRSNTLQKSAGGIDRLTTDEGGHLVATRFNGPAHEANHIAQDIKLNRGKFKQLENSWSKDVNLGRTVKVKIDLMYPDASQRPKSLIVNYTVDGVEQKARKFANGAQPREHV